jgi:Zn-dependent protease
MRRRTALLPTFSVTTPRGDLVESVFNPLKHVDPVGTILLPGILLLLRSPFLFGYAKPVPVNYRALRFAVLRLVSTTQR